METPKNKEQLEAELREIEENLRQDEGIVQQAEDDLKKIGGDKKPWFSKDNILKAGAIATAGFVGYTAAEKVGESAGEWAGGRGSNAPIKETASTNVALERGTNAPYVSTATNLTAEMKKLQDEKKTKTPEPTAPTIEQIKATMRAEFAAQREEVAAQMRKEVEKVKAKLEAQYANATNKNSNIDQGQDDAFSMKSGLGPRTETVKSVKETTKPAPTVSPKIAPKVTPETHGESIAKIKAKLDRGERLNSNEARIWNNHLISQPTVIRFGDAPATSKKEIATPEHSSGFNYTYGPRPQGYDNPYGNNHVNYGNYYDNQGQHAPEDMQMRNPFGLSDGALEQVEEVYERNLEKIFPKDTLGSWNKVKGKSAYEFMNRPENKVKSGEKDLFKHLKEIEKITGVGPKSGVRGNVETIEEYLGVVYQKAAAQEQLPLVELK